MRKIITFLFTEVEGEEAGIVKYVSDEETIVVPGKVSYGAMGRGRRSRIVAYVMGARVAIFAEEGVILVVACVTGV